MKNKIGHGDGPGALEWKVFFFFFFQCSILEMYGGHGCDIWEGEGWNNNYIIIRYFLHVVKCNVNAKCEHGDCRTGEMREKPKEP